MDLDNRRVGGWVCNLFLYPFPMEKRPTQGASIRDRVAHADPH